MTKKKRLGRNWAMPLIKSSSKGAVSKNISEMQAAGHPRAQAIAAALSVARKSDTKLPKKTKTKPRGKVNECTK